MLRKVHDGPTFFAVVASLIAMFVIFVSILPPGVLIILCNGIFFGAFFTIVATYWPILQESFFGSRHYDKAFHYSFSISLLWLFLLYTSGLSVWYRINDFANTYNDSIHAEFISYLRLIAIGWQSLVLTEDVVHDRKVLLVNLAIGGTIALILIGLQAWGTGWFVLY